MDHINLALESPMAALKGKKVALYPLSALPFMLSFISFTSCVILPNSDRIILHSLSKIKFSNKYAIPKNYIYK